MKRILTMMLCVLFIGSLAYAQETKKKSDKTTVKFFIEEMDCANCVKKIEKNIAFEKGVTDLKVDLPTRVVEVTYRNKKTTEKKLLAAFKKIGMEAETLKEGKEAPLPKTKEHQHGEKGHKH